MALRHIHARRPPVAMARLLDRPGVTVDLRVFCTPRDDGTHALATVLVIYRLDRVAVELTYEEAILPEVANPKALLLACTLGIFAIWGGPKHFVRFGTRSLVRTARN